MYLKDLCKKLTKILNFNVSIKDVRFIDNQLINIVLSINNKCNFNKVLNLIKLLDVINFNINIVYQHDIGFYHIDIINFYSLNDDNLNDDDINNIIYNNVIDDLNDIDIIINDDDLNDDDLINKINIIDDIDDIDDDLKYIKYHQYKQYDINNNVIDNLNDDDLKDIDDMNKKYLSFNKHMIVNMIIKRDIKGLDNLFNKFLTKNRHLKYDKHKKGVKKIKKVILNKYQDNTFKDEYILKDYKKLSYLNNYYFMLYNDDDLKDEYNIKIFNGFNYNDVEYFKTPTSIKDYHYYINLLK